MATRTTQRRTSTPTRPPRAAGRSGTQVGRSATQAGRSGTQAGRFGRTSSSSSPSRSFGRSPQPTPRFGRTPVKTKSSRFGRSSKAKPSGLAGLLSGLTSAKAAPKPGAKGAGGLLAAVAAAGFAYKNRSKVAAMGRKRDADPVIDGQPQTVPPAV
jgi:hypothetical protein